MEPIRSPSPVFITDEDIEKEYNNTYEIVRKIFLNWGCISSREIRSLCRVNVDVANKIMDQLKSDFIDRRFR